MNLPAYFFILKFMPEGISIGTVILIFISERINSIRFIILIRGLDFFHSIFESQRDIRMKYSISFRIRACLFDQRPFTYDHISIMRCNITFRIQPKNGTFQSNVIICGFFYHFYSNVRPFIGKGCFPRCQFHRLTCICQCYGLGTFLFRFPDYQFIRCFLFHYFIFSKIQFCGCGASIRTSL